MQQSFGPGLTAVNKTENSVADGEWPLKEFWVVAKLDGRCNAKVRHPSEQSAVDEAKRLAAGERGMAFFVLRSVTKVLVESESCTGALVYSYDWAEASRPSDKAVLQAEREKVSSLKALLEECREDLGLLRPRLAGAEEQARILFEHRRMAWEKIMRGEQCACEACLYLEKKSGKVGTKTVVGPESGIVGEYFWNSNGIGGSDFFYNYSMPYQRLLLERLHEKDVLYTRMAFEVAGLIKERATRQTHGSWTTPDDELEAARLERDFLQGRIKSYEEREVEYLDATHCLEGEVARLRLAADRAKSILDGTPPGEVAGDECVMPQTGSL